MAAETDRIRVMLTFKKEEYDLLIMAAEGIPVSTWCRAKVLKEARVLLAKHQPKPEDEK